MTPWIDTRAVTLYDPLTRPASVLGLELLAIAIAGLTLWHAVRSHRRGDRAALLTWVTILVYGVTIEIIVYNAVDNFAHAQFTVMFYDRLLPLYVTAIYPVLLYTGIATARRLGLPPLVEAFAAGALIVAMDAPFDVVGPVAGWWVWYDTDPNIAYRWLGVPVTSYYWHLTFGGTLAAVTAWTAARSARPGGPRLWLALPSAVATMVIGFLCFVPLHLLAAVGVSHGVTVATALVGCAAAAIVARKKGGATRGVDRALLLIWLAFYGYHAVVAAALANASIAGWPVRFAFVGVVAVAAAVVALPPRPWGPWARARAA